MSESEEDEYEELEASSSDSDALPTSKRRRYIDWRTRPGHLKFQKPGSEGIDTLSFAAVHLWIPQYCELEWAEKFSEVSRLEGIFGRELWDFHFFNTKELATDKELDEVFRASIVDSYINCILCERRADWVGLAYAISQIEADHRKKSKRYVARPHSAYLSMLYLCTVQRNLELILPVDLLAELIDNCASSFKAVSFGLNDLMRNPAGFFEIHSFIFKVGSGLTEKAHAQGSVAVREASFLFVNPQWLFMANEFEQYCLNKTEEAAELLIDKITFQFETLTADYHHALVLFTPFLELLVDLADEESLEKVADICNMCPALFQAVHRVFLKRDRPAYARKVFQDVVKQNAVDLAHYDCSHGWLLERSRAPDEFGDRLEILSENLPAAFGVLDLGRNRTSYTAWKTLYETVKRVESMPQLIMPFYSRRKSWWTRFHSVAVDPKTEKLRRKCFRRLEASL